jgi:hypothetical protein
MSDSAKWMALDEDFNVSFVETPNPWMAADLPKLDQRSKNRWREHSEEGHDIKVLNPEARAQNYPDHKLYHCTCGWLGWLIPKESNEGT